MSPLSQHDTLLLCRKMNTTLTNSTLYELHPLILSFSSSIVMSVYIIYFSLGLPLNICVIILLIRAGGLDGSLIFSLSQTVTEMLFALPAPLFILCHVNMKNLCFEKPVAFFVFLCLSSRIFFQCCVCFERYLAVVHPILYLKYKLVNCRVAKSVFVWIYSFISGIVAMQYFSDLPFTVFGILLIIILSMHLFFCFSILRILRRPRPGEKERTDGTTSVVRKKALELVFLNLVAFLIQTIPLVVSCGIRNGHNSV